MATSSIFANVVLTTDDEAKRVCDAYDEFVKKQNHVKPSVKKPYLSKNPSSFAHIDRALKRMEAEGK